MGLFDPHGHVRNLRLAHLSLDRRGASQCSLQANLEKSADDPGTLQDCISSSGAKWGGEGGAKHHLVEAGTVMVIY